MEFIGEFSISVFDQEEEGTIDRHQASWEETIVGHKILKLKANTIPRGFFTLERLFNSNDVETKPTV